jgi:DNA-binding SARP family transcriptional activator
MAQGLLRLERLTERLVASDPTAEEAQRALIKLYQHRGKARMSISFTSGAIFRRIAMAFAV